MWVARDENGDLALFENKPELFDNMYMKTSGFCFVLPEDMFPEITFSGGPRQVSLTLDTDDRDRFSADKFVDNETTPVETRNGRKVTVYSVQRNHLYSVVGEAEGDGFVNSWTEEGRSDDESEGDNEKDLMFSKKE